MDDSSFVTFFQSLPEKPNGTIRIFDRHDYYTVHGCDAVLVAREHFHTTSVIKMLGSANNKLESVLLNKMNFEVLAKDLLLVKQYRVEVYQQSKSKAESGWTLAFKASPGNLHQMEEIVFGKSALPFSSKVMSLRIGHEKGRMVVGMASADSSTRILEVCQVFDDDHFSNVESLLVQLNPKECLLVAKDSSAGAIRLQKVVQHRNILVTERKKSDFTEKDIVQDLNRLMRSSTCSSAAYPELDLHFAMASLAALIKYLEMMSDETNFGKYQLVTFNSNQYMRLGSAAVQALNLDHSVGEDKTTSLLGLFSKCKTPQGQRLLAQWVRQPLLDPVLIEERLDLVELLLEDIGLRQSLMGESLNFMPDFLHLARKFEQAKGNLQDCVCVYQALLRLPGLVSALSGYHGKHKLLLEQLFLIPLKSLQEDFLKYQEMVETTIDLELVQHHEFLIRPSFDERLLKLSSDMDSIEKQVHAILNEVAHDLSLEPGKVVKLERNDQHGYFLRVNKKVEKTLRGQRRLIILETRNDGIRFTCTPLRSLSEEYLQVMGQYNSTQEALVQEVLEIVAGYVDPLRCLGDYLAQLDVFCSFASVAASAPMPYTRPVITPKGCGDIVMKSARHPCLEMQDDVAFIANDVNLIRDDDMFKIITGPNMGGKSTYIRMVGVIVLMAQIGSFVPASYATVSVVDSIFARVGAGDSQLKGVSTFMAEMLETASILRTASKDSLIIIDELGRGTSTYDGFGLAWAIAEHIATEIHAFCLFATHFHELTALENKIPCVSNLHVTALTSDGTLTLLYCVKKGVCDRSFGIHVAELADFPPSVVENSRRKATELEVYQGGCTNNESAQRESEIKDGNHLIEEYLQEIHSLPLDGMSDAEFEEKMDQLRQRVLRSGNSYIQALLS